MAEIGLTHGDKFRNTSGTVVAGQFTPGEIVTFDHTDGTGSHVFHGEDRPERGGWIPAAALTGGQVAQFLEAVKNDG